MKTKTFLLLFILGNAALIAQNKTAYAYFFINKNLGNRDVFIFTYPKSFKYVEGSSYVFCPVEFEKLAQKAIERKLETYNTASNGLFINQISNGTRTSLENLDNTLDKIDEEMLEVYNYQKSHSSNNISVILLDIDNGSVFKEYNWSSTTKNTNRGSQGNAY